MDKKISYLRARDQSMIRSPSFVREPQKLKLIEDEFEDEDRPRDNHVETIEEEAESGHLDVYLRLKNTKVKANLYEIRGNTLHCLVPMESQSGRNVKDGQQLTKVFTFTAIFDSDSKQIEVFNSVVKRKLLKFLNGENSNLLTYGTSGAGKTFTIVGTNEQPGMIPQCLEYLFKSLPKLSKLPVTKPKSGGNNIIWLTRNEKESELNYLDELLDHSVLKHEKDTHYRTFTDMQKRLSLEPVASLDESDTFISIWVSFAEIYNEQVYDLFDVSRNTMRKKLKIYNNNGETYIKNLRPIAISNSLDAYLLLQYGLLNLNYASTAMNSHSSRSHCIFTITMVQSTERKSKMFHVNRINFCDLAGSERTKKTNNLGCRLFESNNINNSLLVLGRCINTIRTIQKGNTKAMVPFRESKLTQLFHKALSGLEDISMIVNINPERQMFDETIHSLNFSALAKAIVLDTTFQPSKNPSNMEFGGRFGNQTIEKYEEKIDQLQWQVQNLCFELQEQEMVQEARETDIRQSLIANFKEMLNDSKKKAELLMEDRLAAKDEEIAELMDEIEKLKNTSGDDNSIICIDSDDDDDQIADLSYNTRKSTSLILQKYEDLYESHENIKLNYIVLEKKVEEFQKVIEMKSQQVKDKEYKNKILLDELHKQKLEVLKLEDENDTLEDNMRCSIRYTQTALEEYEENDSDSCASDES